MKKSKYDFEFDPEKPLDRYKGESRKANQALRDYVFMGRGRTLRKLMAIYIKQASNGPQAEKPPTVKESTMFTWSTRLRWQERLDAFLGVKFSEDEQEWHDRRLEIRQKEYSLGDDLMDLAERILSEGPSFLKTRRRFVKGENGNPDKEIITVAIDGKLLIAAAKTGSDLSRRATGMEQDKHSHEHTGKDGEPLLDFDPDKYEQRQDERMARVIVMAKDMEKKK